MSTANLKIRHPTENDIAWITQTTETGLVSPFQTQNVKLLLEITSWSLIMTEDDVNKAYAAFMDYPRQDHYSAVWHKDIRDRWEQSQYYGVRSLFLHFMVSNGSDIATLMTEIIKVTFCSLSAVEWVCILTENSELLHPDIQSLFHRDEAVENGEFQFWTTRRDFYVPKIGIRCKRSEDYLELKNLFRQMYGPFKNNNLQRFTLDFLDYGEDRCPTYKYFTFDDDNTYIGIAENQDQKAIGFIYATIQRVDLSLMNSYFQLESVYGLRKKHPDDVPEISFEVEDLSGSDDSCDEEDEIRDLVEDLLDETIAGFEVSNCLNDIIDEVYDGIKPRRKRRKDSEIETVSHNDKCFMNSRKFDLNNKSHLKLITRNSIKNFTLETLVRLVNSPSFDPKNYTHMMLVPRLDKAIKEIDDFRICEILNSEHFDPSLDEFAIISTYVMSYMPEDKLSAFQKSSIGYQIYEKLLHLKAEAKKVAPKVKKNKPALKLSYKDTQAILHHTRNVERLTENTTTKKKTGIQTNETRTDELKHFQYRNMGFISGLTVRGKYRVETNCQISKIQEPFGYEKRLDSKTSLRNKDETGDLEKFIKYAVPEMETEPRVVQEIQVYNGGTNCFYVEQFAIEQEYESQSLELIQAVFKCFPRVDYAMLLLPYGTRQVPHLRHHFSVLPARPFSVYGKELYVFHKAGFNRSYDVRLYNNDDIKGVHKLIGCSCLKDYLLKDLGSGTKNNGIRSIVLISEGTVFGIAIIKELKEVGKIKRTYDIAERINTKYYKCTSHGLLLHCVIHPIFKFLGNIFLKECMRLSEKSILYYKVYPTHLIPYDPSAWQSLCNVIEHFTPMKPVKKSPQKAHIVLNPNEDGGENRNKMAAENENNFYCLTYTCMKTIMKDKKINSSRIVVVGDSSISLGVLESLIYNAHSKYTNLFIISKRGIKNDCKLDEKCHSFLPIDTDYTKSILDHLCLPAWVTVIRGEVVSIKKNTLRLREISEHKSKHFSVGFDYLVISCDPEFQTLYPKKPISSLTDKQHQYNLLKELNKSTYTVGRCASNVFSVNNEEDAANVLNWLWRYFLKKVESRTQPKKKYKSLAEKERDKKEGRIVIYGNFLETYSALGNVMSENFPLSIITFIKMKNESGVTPFHSSIIEEAVGYVINKSGIDIVKDVTITFDKEIDEVTSFVYELEGETIQLDCCALLLFEEKEINCSTFQTFHKSPLSFSLPLRESKGHPYLLVNTNFQTNKENVFAAGTVTEMHAKNGTSLRFEDCTYNKREIGLAIGENLSKATENCLTLSKNQFPVFSTPVVTYAKLPCDLIYILIETASPDLTLKQFDGKKVETTVKLLVLGNLRASLCIVPFQPGAKNIQDAESDVQESEGGKDSRQSNNASEDLEGKVEKDQKDNLESEVQETEGGKVEKDQKDSLESDVQESEGRKESGQTNDTPKEKIEKHQEDHFESQEGHTKSDVIADASEKLKEKQGIEKTIERILPDDPEYLALTFNETETVSGIECLTKMDPDVSSLKNLYGIHVSQLYKTFQKIREKCSEKLFFRIADDWVLPLDCVMFDDEDSKINNSGYEGYWRPGYPEEIETKLNTFWDSFANFEKSKNRKD